MPELPDITPEKFWPSGPSGGRILADRALSRLLKKTFPRSIDE